MPRWFGPKIYGYGVTPCSWQGWLATAIFVLTLLGTKFIPWDVLGLPHWSRVLFVPLLIVAFLGLITATYDGD